MRKLYVAYGSNLNIDQMSRRCPTARIYGVGVLNNWELVYRGGKANSHATIQRKPGSVVPVLLWEIGEFDERRLDVYEGYPFYYFKQTVMPEINGVRKKAMVYIMDKSQRPGKPSDMYIETIRQGYMDNNLDLGILECSLEKNTIECM